MDLVWDGNLKRQQVAVLMIFPFYVLHFFQSWLGAPFLILVNHHLPVLRLQPVLALYVRPPCLSRFCNFDSRACVDCCNPNPPCCFRLCKSDSRVCAGCVILTLCLCRPYTRKSDPTSVLDMCKLPLYVCIGRIPVSLTPMSVLCKLTLYVFVGRIPVSLTPCMC